MTTATTATKNFTDVTVTHREKEKRSKKERETTTTATLFARAFLTTIRCADGSVLHADYQTRP